MTRTPSCHSAIRQPNVAPADDGVDVVTLRSALGVVSVLLTYQLGRPVVHGADIEALLARGRFDVVHFHNASLVGGPGLFAFGRGSATLYTAHEHWLIRPTHVLWRHGRERCTGRECFRCTLHYGRPPQLWRNTGLLERALDDVDTFIALSEFSRESIANSDFRATWRCCRRSCSTRMRTRSMHLR